MTEQTVKCPICGEPYVIYPYYTGDQSACISCRSKARRKNDVYKLEQFIAKKERRETKRRIQPAIDYANTLKWNDYD